MTNRNSSPERQNQPEEKFKIRFTSLLKPAIYAIVFSCLYSLAYLWISGQIENQPASLAAQILLVSVYGVGLYFVCTLVWGKQHGVLNLSCTGKVFGWNIVWAAAAALISWLYVMVISSSSLFLLLAVQILAGVLLIFLIPFTLLFYKGVYEKEEDLKSLLAGVWKSFLKAPTGVLNPWLLLFLALVGWDTLFSGPMGIYYGFNAAGLLSSLIFIGNPMFYWMMLLYVSGGQGAFMYMIILYILSGLIFTWLWLNLAAWTGTKWMGSRSVKKADSN
ncbi:MAG: hypothetical protein HUJ54_14470 [Erysipelotrichaceae bacterium]|nr:hypothetical protein [Erysipelotrichaceae bacterium]